MRLPVAAVFVPTLMRTAQTAAPAATYAHRDFPARLASAIVAANEITAWISRALRLLWQGFRETPSLRCGCDEVKRPVSPNREEGHSPARHLLGARFARLGR